MDIIQGHNNITMMLHNIHTDLVATGNASTTWTPPKAKVSVNVVKHHCYINMNFSSVHDILSERVGCGGTHSHSHSGGTHSQGLWILMSVSELVIS